MVKYEILAQFIPVQKKDYVLLNPFGFSVSNYHGWHEIIVKDRYKLFQSVPAIFKIDKNVKHGLFGMLGQPQKAHILVRFDKK